MTKNTILNRDLIVASLSKFYAHKPNMDKVIAIIDGKSPLSLRLIDWFVTNFCKRKGIRFHEDYRAQLKAFSKHNFDPFKRRDRIKYFYTPDDSIITTVGQLNFFKWALENGIIDHIEERRLELEAEMMLNVGSDDGCEVVASAAEDAKADQVSVFHKLVLGVDHSDPSRHVVLFT